MGAHASGLQTSSHPIFGPSSAVLNVLGYDTGDMSELESAAIGLLNSVKYLYLRKISEPDKRVFNSLRIVVEEAAVNEAARVVCDRPELEKALRQAHPIESIEGCKKFRLSWKHYLAYLVTEELVGSNAPKGYEDEVYTGNILRVYTTSHFLDHIMRDTGGHLQKVLHHKLICLDHLVDVVSYDPPEVEVLTPGDLTYRTQ